MRGQPRHNARLHTQSLSYFLGMDDLTIERSYVGHQFDFSDLPSQHLRRVLFGVLILPRISLELWAEIIGLSSPIAW